jgi:hypothetical protein
MCPIKYFYPQMPLLPTKERRLVSAMQDFHCPSWSDLL